MNSWNEKVMYLAFFLMCLPAPGHVASVTGGLTHLCAVQDKELFCLGPTGETESLDFLYDIGPISQIVSSEKGQCAQDDNMLYCWSWKDKRVSYYPELAKANSLSLGNNQVCGLLGDKFLCRALKYAENPPSLLPESLLQGRFDNKHYLKATGNTISEFRETNRVGEYEIQWFPAPFGDDQSPLKEKDLGWWGKLPIIGSDYSKIEEGLLFGSLDILGEPTYFEALGGYCFMASIPVTERYVKVSREKPYVQSVRKKGIYCRIKREFMLKGFQSYFLAAYAAKPVEKRVVDDTAAGARTITLYDKDYQYIPKKDAWDYPFAWIEASGTPAATSSAVCFPTQLYNWDCYIFKDKDGKWLEKVAYASYSGGGPLFAWAEKICNAYASKLDEIQCLDPESNGSFQRVRPFGKVLPKRFRLSRRNLRNVSDALIEMSYEKDVPILEEMRKRLDALGDARLEMGDPKRVTKERKAVLKEYWPFLKSLNSERQEKLFQETGLLLFLEGFK